jgi:hypothetical protein
VATGSGRDPHTAELSPGFFDQAADVIAETIPNARRVTLEDQTHVADPTVLAPVLKEFFRATPA